YMIDICVVVWRAWLLHSESRRVKIVLVSCVFVIIACAIVDFAMIALKPLTDRPAVRTLLWAAPLLFTNIIATMLVGARAWHLTCFYRSYRRDITSFLKQKSDVGKLLTVLLETGVICCSIWIVYVALASTDHPGTYSASDTILHAYHSLSGIYPTLVILVIALRRHEMQSLVQTNLSQGVRFRDLGEATASAQSEDTE
ncbi:hypothetical protein EV715DRAFT_188514, partial [Schizophyllum commune]